MSDLFGRITNTIDGASYTVDNAGNRTAKTDQRTAVATSYGYDSIYQAGGRQDIFGRVE